jgi:hypothetical protein
LVLTSALAPAGCGPGDSQPEPPKYHALTTPTSAGAPTLD